VCGQHHAPAAFTPGKDPVRMYRRLKLVHLVGFIKKKYDRGFN
jgi:hypothetical protein